MTTYRMTMDTPATQMKSACNGTAKKVRRRQAHDQVSYGQIRSLMKRLKTALESKLRQGRPPKYCRMCHRELSKMMGEELRKRQRPRIMRTEKRSVEEERSVKETSIANNKSALQSIKSRRYRPGMKKIAVVKTADEKTG